MRADFRAAVGAGCAWLALTSGGVLAETAVDAESEAAGRAGAASGAGSSLDVWAERLAATAIGLRRVRAELDAALASARAGDGQLLPEVGLAGAAARAQAKDPYYDGAKREELTSAAYIYVRQNVFNGGRDLLARDARAAQAGENAHRLELAQRVLVVSLRARLADWQLASATARSLADYVAAADGLEASFARREQLGTRQPAARSRAAALAREARLARAAANADATAAVTAMCAHLGCEPGSAAAAALAEAQAALGAEADAGSVAPSAASSSREAIDEQVLAASLTRADLEQRAASRSTWLPRLDAELRAGVARDDERVSLDGVETNDTSGGRPRYEAIVSASWPLFAPDRLAQAAAKAAAREAAALRLDERRQSRASRLAAVTEELARLTPEVDSARAVLGDNRKIVAGGLAALARGDVTDRDLLDALRDGLSLTAAGAAARRTQIELERQLVALREGAVELGE
jgi:outer membrane protein TolC